MAHIKKMTDKRRTLPFRAQVKRKGHPTLVKMFQTRSQAERWSREQEKAILETGLPLTVEELKKHTVGQLVKRYLGEVTPTKGSHVSEATVLNRFLRYDICKKSLAYVDETDAYEYKNKRLKEIWKGKPIKPSTVRREINSIGNIFVKARREWGFKTLSNPFARMEIKGSHTRRKRRLGEGELEKLLKACEDCRGLNKIYVPLAIHLAIDTGMRLQEIFNLTWEDVDLYKRRIEITKSKTDHLTGTKGREIVLPFHAWFYLVRLRKMLSYFVAKGKAKGETIIPGHLLPTTPGALIFPMTNEAFKQSWADVRERAEISGLVFHDLRREAGSRFDEAGLTKAEHDLMMGHASTDMASLYINTPLKLIRDKLDRHLFDGKTFEELFIFLVDAIKDKNFEVTREKQIELATKDLPFHSDLKEQIRQVIASKDDELIQREDNVVPFTKAKAS